MKSKTHYEFKYMDSSAKHAHSYLLPELCSMLSGKKALKILDLGCGNGYTTKVLAERGHDVIGIDSSLSGITMARKNFPGLRFINENVYSFDCDKWDLVQRFDVVFSLEVIEHLCFPRELFKVAEKCLRPGGVFIVSTPYHGYLKNIAISLLGKWDQHHTTLFDEGHLRFFSIKTLSILAQESGFNDSDFKCVGRIPFLWKSMIMRTKKI